MSSNYTNRIDDVIPIFDFNRYKVGDHVLTKYYNKGSILCGVIQTISISDQRVQILVDNSSELRKCKFINIFGVIVK